MQLFRSFRKVPATKIREMDDILGFALHASGRVDAIKQGSGMYGAGFGEGAFSETAWGTNIALSQSTMGWSAAYTVSTWVYRCIEARKSAIHRMPWSIYNKRTNKPILNHPLEIALKRSHQKPFKKIEQSQLLYGETFIEKAVNDYRYVSDLFWLNNNGMAVLIGAGRILGYSYTALQGGTPANFEPDEIAFMKTENPFNDLRGMSPTEVIMDEVAIDKDVARVVRAYYANDTRVGLLLIPKTSLNPGDSERFMAEWKKQNQGVNKAGKPILMPYDISVERVQEPATLDDVQLRESTRREIAAAYGVPLSLAGAWDEAKYQSLPEQRKSFYEETVIPECDNIGEFINTDLMPYFDSTGRAEFRYNYMSILALTEDAQKKNDLYSNRLVSGGITRAEFRAALGHPVRPTDDVYYIPAGSTVVPADQPAYVTPTANVVDDTSNEQSNIPPADQASSAPSDNKPPDGPKPPTAPAPADKPTSEPPSDKPTEPSAKSIQPPQSNPLDELAAWEKKAINNNALKAASFVCYTLPADVQVAIREALRTAGKTAARPVIREIFSVARKALAQPPSVTLDYWAEYDRLMDSIGSVWLNDYMARALEALLPIEDEDQVGYNVQSALDSAHTPFSEALLGTDDSPGPLVKLIQAGMAAGQQAINHGSAANPKRPMLGKAIDVDWNLLAHEARDFAKTYLFNLIRNVDETTRKATQDAVTKWIESGEPLDSLRSALRDIFQNEARAALISQTESTRAFAEGSKERYRRADIQYVKWNTVNAGDVCPVCEALGNEPPAPIDQGFKADSGDSFPPNHPGCRCWLRPVLSEDEL